MSDEKHCPTCACGHRVPFQGSRKKRIADGSISWEEHLEIYRSYAGRYGNSQSAVRMAERGGFSWGECLSMTGHEPRTYQPITVRREGPPAVSSGNAPHTTDRNEEHGDQGASAEVSLSRLRTAIADVDPDYFEATTYDDLRVQISDGYMGETGDLVRDYARALLDLRYIRSAAEAKDEQSEEQDPEISAPVGAAIATSGGDE
jgi:hypothetical protein